MNPPKNEITQLLRAWHEGDAAAFDQMIPLVYDELHALAQRALRRHTPDQTLQTTAVVNEAWLRLRHKAGIEWADRTHFFAVAARAMRFLLVDHARQQIAAKQNAEKLQLSLAGALSGALPGGLSEVDAANESWTIEVLALNQALDRLAVFDEQKCRIVEMRYFAGMNVEETAEVLGLAAITVKREWARAKAWLYHELNHHMPTPEETLS